MSEFLALVMTLTILTQARAESPGDEKIVVTTPANQVLSCDSSAGDALAKMNQGIQDLQTKATAAEQRLRRLPGFENATFPVKTEISENMRNVLEIRVFIFLPQSIRNMLISGPYSTPELANQLKSNVEMKIKVPNGSCVLTRGDAKPLI